jgi:hypothetical protein
MKEIILPLIPAGSTPLSDILSVETVADTIIYCQGIFPVFSHHKDDKQTFRMYTAQLISEGRCKFTIIRNKLGIPSSSLRRAVNLYKTEGVSGFYKDNRKGRKGTVLTEKILNDVQLMLDEGFSVSIVSERFAIKYDTVQKAVQDGRLHKSKVKPSACAEVLTSKSERTVEDSNCELGTACTRLTDRICSSLLKTGPAETKFKNCSDITFGGVLCALPALEANGLLRHLNNYFKLPEGFYGLVHIVITLAFMALCRIKNPEQLRHKAPGELGKLIGLDRIPEVRTIREKLSILTENLENVTGWSLKLSQDWMNDFPKYAGVLYIDGHSKIYTGGLTEIPRKYFTRLRLCMRGTNVYYVNDILGQPFFSVEKVIDPGMIKVLWQDIIPRLLTDIPNQPTEKELEDDPKLHRFILVFDREGYSPKLFKDLWEKHRVACITYHKFPEGKWEENDFKKHDVNMPDGEIIEMELAEREHIIGSNKKEQAYVKEVRKKNKSGHQTSIVTTGLKLNMMLIAAFMFTRWVQENFFKYMIYHYNIDKLIEYGTVPVSGLERIVNPAWKKIDSKIRSLNSKITARNAKFAKIQLNPESEPKLITEQIKIKSETLEEINNFQKDLQEAKAERKLLEKHINFEDLPEENKFEKLKPNGKMFIDTIKFIAYRAETGMSTLIKQHLNRNDDARPIIRDLLTKEADFIPCKSEKKLIVQIHRMASPKIDKAVEGLLEELNKTETTYPGTDFQLVYRQAGTNNKKNDSV